MTTPARVSAGVPDGGRFAAMGRTEGEPILDSDGAEPAVLDHDEQDPVLVALDEMDDLQGLDFEARETEDLTRIQELAGHEHPWVRAGAAGNPFAPAGTVDAMAQDPAPIVRRIVARNSSDTGVLRTLATDDDALTRKTATAQRARLRARRASERERWGSADTGVGRRTPWGSAQHAEQIAPGITAVSTAGHGGIKLSPERNAAVAVPWRTRSGWYEEDCEASIVAMTFPDEFPGSAESARASARNWFPDQYEKVTGTTIQPAESRIRDEKTFLTEHANDLIGISAQYSDDHPGMTEVQAKRGGRDAGKTGTAKFLVPRDEYRARNSFGFVIDPGRHQQI